MMFLQSIPLPPPLISFFCSNPKIKKLRCLNLKHINHQTSDIPSDILSSSIFAPTHSKDILLNENELDDYFKISQAIQSKPSQETKSKTKDTPISLYHLFENKNKYATSFVIIKKYQLESTFPLNLKTILSTESYPLTERELKFVDGQLTDYEFLVSMKTIFPSKEEMKTITAHMCNMTNEDISSMGFIDKMYNSISQFPEVSEFINAMITLIEMKNDLNEVTHSLNTITGLFEGILSNDKLSFVIGIMLKINNYLNRSTGGKELKGFDLVSLENVLDLKINSKHFFNIIGKYYSDRYFKETLLNKKELGNVYFSISYLSNSINNEFNKEKVVNQYEQAIKEIESIVKNSYIKEALSNQLIEIIQEMIGKTGELKIKEQKIKEKLILYLLLDPQVMQENLNVYLIKVLKIILKIEDKLKGFFGIKHKNSFSSEFKCDTRQEGYLLTEGISTKLSSYNSNRLSDNLIHNKENIYVHNEDNPELDKAFEKLSISNNKQHLLNTTQTHHLIDSQGLRKYNMPISGLFIKRYCL